MMLHSAVIFAIVVCGLALWVHYDRGAMDVPTYLASVVIKRTMMARAWPTSAEDAKAWRFMSSLLKKSAFYRFKGRIVDLTQHAEDGTPLLVRVYIPPSPDSSSLRPVLMWMHGGGWSVGGVLPDSNMVGRLAAEAGMVAVSVSYRLAPEHPYPAAVNDCWRALKWLDANIAEYGGDRLAIYLAGESAGGNLAAVLTSFNLDTSRVPTDQRVHIKGSILVSPSLGWNASLPSFQTHSSFGFLSTAQIQHFRVIYANHNTTAMMEYTFAPLLTPASILAQYPPVVLISARHDPMVDEDEAFAAMLRDAGAAVTTKTYESSSHYFFGMDLLPSGYEAVSFAVSHLVSWKHASG